MTINYTFTAFVWVIVLIGGSSWISPTSTCPALTITSIAIAALVPLLFWPFSKTIWASVDFVVYRTSPDYGSARPPTARAATAAVPELLAPGSRTPRSAATASASS